VRRVVLACALPVPRCARRARRPSAFSSLARRRNSASRPISSASLTASSPSSADASKKISYADLIGGQFFHSQIGWNKQYGNPLALIFTGEAKTPDQYKIVGTSQPRLDVQGKVFGTHALGHRYPC